MAGKMVGKMACQQVSQRACCRPVPFVAPASAMRRCNLGRCDDFE